MNFLTRSFMFRRPSPLHTQVLNEPIYLQLEDLLKMQQNNETRLQMERVWLNVNLLIHFLNTNFLGGK